MTYNNQYPVIPGPLSPSNPIFIKLELLKIEEIFKYYIYYIIYYIISSAEKSYEANDI